MEITSKFITPGIILLATLASGFWLGSLGKPLNSLLFNIHKLIALAAVVLSVIQIRNILIVHAPQTTLVVLLVLGGMCILALFATGGLMSAGVGDYNLWRNIHRLSTVLFIGLAASSVWLLR